MAMASSSSTPVYPCRWDYCSSTFSSPAALRDHLRAHWQNEEPQRVRVKRHKVGPGQWEALSEETKLASELPLRHPGDATTTTEGTTLSYPYPPSFPSQPPPLPLFLPDDDDLYDAPTSSHVQARDSRPTHEGRRPSPRSRVSNVRVSNQVEPGSFGIPSSQTILEPHRPQLSQNSDQLSMSQQTDYEKMPGIFDTSFESSSGPSQTSTHGAKSAADGPMPRVEQDEWRCFRPDSPDASTLPPSSSPFVAPTQPVSHSSPAIQPSSHQTSRKDLDAEDAKPNVSNPHHSVSSPQVHRSSASRSKGKAFIAPRPTRPPIPAPEPTAQKPQGRLGFGRVPGTHPTASTNSQATGSTPSWLTDKSPSLPQPKPSAGVGQGRPPDQLDTSRVPASGSESSHTRGDSYSQSRIQFGMSLSQGSDKATQSEARKTSSAGGSQSVGFSWGQSR